MLKKRLKNPIFLIYLLLIYVILQFSWWLYLIFSLYNEIYLDAIRLAQKKWMLLGEGSVFLLILTLAVAVILKAFKHERELSRQQENFVLSVTHELKTPISSVKLYLQTLKKRELTADKRTEIYNSSLVEISRLDNLVNNLLLTRSIENNNYFIDKQSLNLKAFIEKKVTILSDSILKNHTLKLNLEEVEIKVDQIGFESIFINLVENAVKYSPKESEITVELKQDANNVFFNVKDEGIGMPKEKRSLAFKKFYREENEMTRKSKGTGLGLFITEFLVKQHGGSITLNNNTPKGMLVEVILKKKD